MNDWPQLSQFTHFDWIVVVVIAMSALLSLWRGFVREAISLGGWVIAFILANLLALPFADLIGDLIANRTGRYIVAWSIIFVLVLVASTLIEKLFVSLVSISGLGVLDRILGVVFGVLRGALIVMALVFVLREVIPESEREILRQSQLMPHIDVLLGWTTRALEEFRGVEVPGINL